MKRKLLMLILATSLTFGLTGCGEEAERDALIEQIDSLKTEKVELESTVAELKDMATAEKIRTGTEIYIVVINISQSHFTLDLEEHMKDAMNDVDITIPVSKEFYDSVNKGTVIDDSFRMGSFIAKGSIGSWDIVVKDKYIQ